MTTAAPQEGLKTRPRYELVMRVVHPLSAVLVRRLAMTRVEPWQVVVTHSVIGAAAALLLAGDSRWGLVGAALSLQVKTVLDNVDGGLARATGRVTELGRYLDTGLDLIVNVLLFVALARHGPWPLAALALVVLTVVLSYDFNAEVLYREARAGEPPAGDALAATAAAGGARLGGLTPVADPTTPQPARGTLALRSFRGLYRLVLAPQDRLIRTLDSALFRHATGLEYAAAPRDRRQAWSNVSSTGALVNLGLSTQYLVLGLCAALGAPFLYVVIVLAQGIYLIVFQASRVASARRSSQAAA